MKFICKICCITLLVLACCSSTKIPPPDEPVNYLNEKWLAQKANRVSVNGEIISSTDYEPKGWLDAVVPGTVQSTLLFNKLIPDPFFSKNNELIPDIDDVGVAFYTYWFSAGSEGFSELHNRRKFQNIPCAPNQWLEFS